jgi:hypothetical protein
MEKVKIYWKSYDLIHILQEVTKMEASRQMTKTKN